MNLTQLKKLVRQIKPAQRYKLYEWLGEIVRGDQESGPEESQPEKNKKSTANGRAYRLESVRCGKKGCKCADGKLHGP